MKKVLLLCLIALSALIAKADGVAGVEWGATKEQAYSHLSRRFGSVKVTNSLMVTDVVIGSKRYDEAFFNFAWKGSLSYFCSATLYSQTKNTLAEATQDAFNIGRILSDKYDIDYIDWNKNSPEKTIVMMRGGVDPNNSNYYLFIVGVFKLPSGRYCAMVRFDVTPPFNFTDDF